MPFADFQPSSAGAQLAQTTMGLADGFQNLFARAQAISQSAQEFPLRKQLLAAQIAASQSDTTRANLQIRQLNDNMELEGKRLGAASAQMDADKATANATINAQNTYSQLLTQLPKDLQDVQQSLSTATSGSSAGGDPSASGGLDYTSYRAAKLKLAQLEAKYGGMVAGSSNPQLQQVFGQLQGQDKALDFAWNQQLFAESPAMKAKIAGSKTTDQLKAIEADPMFHLVGSVDPSVQAIYDKSFGQAQATEQQAREFDQQTQMKGKELENQQAMKRMELDQEQMKHTVTAGGYTGTIWNDSARNDFNTKVVDTQNVTDNATQLLDISKQIGNNPIKKLDPETRGKAQTLALALSGALKGPLFGGRLSNTDIALLEKVAADPTHLTSLSQSVQGALTKLIELNGKDIDRAAAVNGLKKAASSTSTSAKGSGIQGGSTLPAGASLSASSSQ